MTLVDFNKDEFAPMGLLGPSELWLNIDHIVSVYKVPNESSMGITEILVTSGVIYAIYLPIGEVVGRIKSMNSIK